MARCRKNVPAAALISISDNLIAKETILDEGFELIEQLRENVKIDQHKIAIEELIS
jgi:hypothetical protein